MVHPRARLYGLVSLCAVLAACGGAGGSGVATNPAAPTSSQTTTPTPTPTPTPPVIDYDTAEYRRSTSLLQINAITAYEAGATGSGITVGIIDSGIDLESREFDGRIHPDSRDVVSGRTLDDPDGHGTLVASVLAADKDDFRTHGVAFDAQLLIARSDVTEDGGSVHYDADIAAGVDLAIQAGAKVINMSLGGSAANRTLTEAIRRATEAGIIVVISAGNDSEAQPDSFPVSLSATRIANDLVIIAGAIDSADQLASFSNAAGSSAGIYLSAPGVSVPATDLNDQPVRVSGTSFAAPHVAGAAALLLQAFPNLSPQQVVELLYTSARDIGAAGVDSIFGRGALDLSNAFTPQGSITVPDNGAQSTASVSAPAGGTLSTASVNLMLDQAFGDASQLSAALADVVVLDSFGRAFALDISASVQGRGAHLGLVERLRSRSLEAARSSSDGRIQLSSRLTDRGEAQVWQQFNLNAPDARALGPREGADARSGRVRFAVTPGLGFMAHLADPSAVDVLAGAGLGEAGSAFLATHDETLAGRMVDPGDAFGFGLTLNRADWQASAALNRAQIRLTEEQLRLGNGASSAPVLTELAVAVSREVSPATRIGLSIKMIDERGSVLGSSGSAGLGWADARAGSVQLGAHGKHRLSARWHMLADGALGWTQASLNGVGLTTGLDGLRTSRFSATLTGVGVLSADDTLALRVAQPLRVEGGQAALNVPVQYDYGTGLARFEQRSISLSPSGREIAFEAAYSRPLPFIGDGLATFNVNAFARHQPGHVQDGAADVGGVVQLGARF